MKKLLFLFVGILISGSLFANDGNTPDDAKVIATLNDAAGEAFVFNKADSKIYALNNLGQYEPYGVYEKATTLVMSSGDGEVGYVASSDRASYFNTGYTPTTNTRVVAEFIAPMTWYGDWQAVFATSNSNMSSGNFTYEVHAGYANGDMRIGKGIYGTNNRKIGTMGTNNRRTFVDLDATTGLMKLFAEDGTSLLEQRMGEVVTEESKGQFPLCIFADTRGGNPCDKAKEIKLFSMKIYEGSTLVKDYVPYVQGGQAGLFDKVANAFLAPEGTGIYAGTITAYEGKIVRYDKDNHAYKYSNGSWSDIGAMSFEEISNTDYKNMNNWQTNSGHAGIFNNGKIQFANGVNDIPSYVGTGGFEPLMTKVTVQTGEDYNFSLKYTNYSTNQAQGWQSWQPRVAVWTGYNLSTDDNCAFIDPNAPLSYFNVTDAPISLDFTPSQSEMTLIVQFGNFADGKEFSFKFSDLKVQKYVYPETYPDIDPYAFIEFMPTRFDADMVGYMIVAGGNGYNENEDKAKILDNNADTKFCGNLDQAWFIVKADQPVVAKQYSLITAADTREYIDRNPYAWTVEGSNDAKAWTTLDSHSNNPLLGPTNKQEYTVKLSNNTTAYKYFRFRATKCASGVQIAEFWINAQAHRWGNPTETAATCTTDGTKVSVCGECNAIKTEWIPATAEHNYVAGTCSVCGESDELVTLLHDGQGSVIEQADANPYTMKFKHYENLDTNPNTGLGTDWAAVDFDDSEWDEMIMPVATNSDVDGVRRYDILDYRSLWFENYNAFCFRRTFNVENVSDIEKLIFNSFHDDTFWVYLNGEQVIQMDGWTSKADAWDTWEIDATKLREGKNVLAVYVQQNWGGAYFDFNLKAQMKPITVTVTDAKYATFIAPKDVTTDGSNTTAYKVTKLHDGWVTMEEVAEVPAGAAVVVGADEAGTYTLKRNAAAALDGNILTYSADPISVATAKTYYGLSKGSKGTGFYPVKKGATIAANKPYFLNEDAGAKDFYSLFEDPTGIEGVIIEKLDGTQEIYNVRGQRLNKLERGINIVNGKKVILK